MKKQITLIAALCLAQGTFSMERQEYVAPPLYTAAERGDYDEVSNLLNQGADVNALDRYKQTALYKAACHGHIPVVELLLEKGARIDTPDAAGTTPLMIATHNGHWHTAKLLLAKGANVNTQSRVGRTPLGFAARMGRADLVSLLLAANADMTIKEVGGTTPLMRAVDSGDENTVGVLLTYIPSTERESIKNTFHALFAMKKMTAPQLPKDMRNRIMDEIIAQLAYRQMIRISQFINQSDRNGRTAHWYALHANKSNPAVQALLDLNNPVSRERIGKKIENNIKRILFGKPQEKPGSGEENK